tara:strand:+ start:19954 stop:20853 length:900 start_codon:yes stop_codon:yes gene_type:complete
MIKHYNLDEVFYEKDSLDNTWMIIHRDPATNEITAASPVIRASNGDIDFAKSQDFLENAHIRSISQAVDRSTARHNNPAANLFVNKQIKRVDYLIGEEEGKALRAIVEERFPEYKIWNNSKNVIGTYGAYRAPYTAVESISVYDVTFVTGPDYQPSDELFQPPERFGVDIVNTYPQRRPWYGWKFNLADNSVLCKVVHINKVEGVVYPPLVHEQVGTYYGTFHSEDGTISNDRDMFFFGTILNVERYCEEHGLDMPLFDEFEDGFVPYEHIFVWGIGFDSTTGVPYVMKAYEGRDVECN